MTLLCIYVSVHMHSFLRSDALAQILSLSNVHARSNLLVMETTQGLLTGAMLERMGGTYYIDNSQQLHMYMYCI